MPFWPRRQPPPKAASPWAEYPDRGWLPPRDWREEALCAKSDLPPDAWFPGPGGAGNAARATCAACPVRQACLMHAIAHGEYYGVWGGLNEPQRRAYARQNGIPYRAERVAPLRPGDEGYEVKRPGTGIATAERNRRRRTAA